MYMSGIYYLISSKHLVHTDSLSLSREHICVGWTDRYIPDGGVRGERRGAVQGFKHGLDEEERREQELEDLIHEFDGFSQEDRAAS